MVEETGSAKRNHLSQPRSPSTPEPVRKEPHETESAGITSTAGVAATSCAAHLEAVKLYKVSIKVRPLPHHPRFWDVQFGYLLVWIFAADAEKAGEAAVGVVAAMPFERVTDAVEVQTGEPAHVPELESKVKEAKESGFAWLLVGCVTGTEEDSREI